MSIKSPNFCDISYFQSVSNVFLESISFLFPPIFLIFLGVQGCQTYQIRYEKVQTWFVGVVYKLPFCTFEKINLTAEICAICMCFVP